ncbi:MAG: cytochrome c peroxidase [Longimicrobiales bacterium]
MTPGPRARPGSPTGSTLGWLLVLLSVGPGAAAQNAPPAGLDLHRPGLVGPLAPAAVELGRRLFHDSGLSADSSRSCADCHDPSTAFSDTVRVSTGVGGQRGRRNSPSLVNRGDLLSFFWDGRIRSLETAVLQAVVDPDEMDLSVTEAVSRLRRSDAYVEVFESAFGEAPSWSGVGRALAAFVGSLRSGGSPADRFALGDSAALSTLAREGRRLFEGEAGCWVCHSGPFFTDGRLHNTGVSWGGPDTGLHLRTGQEADRGRFRTAPLRDAAKTPPYMHDGSLATLRDVVEHYDRGGGANPLLDSELRPLDLTEREKRALVAFLESLTGTS